MDTPADYGSYLTIASVLTLFVWLWWWGTRPNKELPGFSLAMSGLEFEPDDIPKRPVIKAPVYRLTETGKNLKDETSLPHEEPSDEAETPIKDLQNVVEERRVIRPVYKSDPREKSPAPVEGVYAMKSLREMYGSHALSDPMSIEDIRKWVAEMIDVGYDLKKVWPNKGSFQIAYMIFNPDR